MPDYEIISFEKDFVEKMDFLVKEVADLKENQRDQLELLRKLIDDEYSSIQEVKKIFETINELLRQDL